MCELIKKIQTLFDRGGNYQNYRHEKYEDNVDEDKNLRVENFRYYII